MDEYDSSGRPTQAGVRSTATGSVHRAQRQFVDSGLRIGESLRSVLSCTSIGSALRPHLMTTSVSVMSSLGRFCHARGEPGAWCNEPPTNHRHPSAVSSTLGGRKELRHPRMRSAVLDRGALDNRAFFRNNCVHSDSLVCSPSVASTCLRARFSAATLSSLRALDLQWR